MELRTASERCVYGLSITTDNVSEMDPEKGKIAALHQKFDAAVEVDYQGGERVYGVYFDYESDHTGKFSVLAGFDGKLGSENTTLKRVVIPEANYLVFTHQGKMPQAVINAWMEVWQYFSNEGAQYQRLYSTYFEYYKSVDEVELYIAVK